MFAKEIYRARRQRLIERMRECDCGGGVAGVAGGGGVAGVAVIPANEYSPNSYLSNSYYFRQDGSFRYFFGLDRPSLWGLIDLDSGAEVLFGEDSSLDDLIWMGRQPLVAESAESVGVNRSGNLSQLRSYIADTERLGRTIHILPPYRGETKIALSSLFDCSISALDSYISPALFFAVAELREVKGAEEIEALEEAYHIGYELHTAAMQMCREGVIEREIGGRLEGIARSMGAGVSFPPICTQHGETLHNIEREGVLQSGRLFLCDAGGESLEGYCSDHTRTYPVSGKFTDTQRDIYNTVLAAYENTKRIARSGMLYNELQEATYRTLAEGLKGVGLLRGSIDEIIETGAVSLFMPHGVSHGLGLDVHDCEAMGERSFDMERYGEFAERSTSCIIRSRWRFSEGTVMSNEPAIYFIPALIEKSRAEGLYRGVVDYDRAERYFDFGGIRIEDDIIITEGGCRQIGSKPIPVTVTELEDYISLWR
ncbi:MAG: aminopeptidase P N-terminal domain-containing protein [Rikenellaceae bacterium]